MMIMCNGLEYRNILCRETHFLIAFRCVARDLVSHIRAESVKLLCHDLAYSNERGGIGPEQHEMKKCLAVMIPEL